MVSLISLTGCTAPVDDGRSNVDPAPQKVVPSPTFIQYVPDDEEVVLLVASQRRGSQVIETIDPTSSAVGVYVDCVGDGLLIIRIDQVGEFPLECTENVYEGTILNEFDVRYTSGPLGVSITAADNILWSVTVTERELTPH